MAESPALPLPLQGRRIALIPASDAKLARRAAAGDEHAFAAIYERYHQELFRYCRAILGDPEDAQDALQGTMASALRALPGETRTISLRPWLYRVARNEALTIVRRRQPVAELDEAVLPFHPPADVDAELRERLRLLVADLGSLPERQRSALIMRELSDLSYEDIAAALDVSGGAARQVVYEARVALQELSEGRTMECDRVRRAISARDGRVLRGRKIRAHLRGCRGCADFKFGLETRTADMQLIAPPLSAVAASGLLATIVGGTSSTGTIGGGLLGGGLAGGTLTAKTVGVIAASTAIGIGAGAAGGVDLPFVGDDSGRPASERSAPAYDSEGSHGGGAAVGAVGASAHGGGATANEAADGSNGGQAAGSENADGAKAQTTQEQEPQGTVNADPDSAAGGASEEAEAVSGSEDAPPGAAISEVRSDGHSNASVNSAGSNAGGNSAAVSNAGGKAKAIDLPEQANVGGALAELKKADK
jgi:RNA polymerase sigma factor (sigma-70 family)